METFIDARVHAIEDASFIMYNVKNLNVSDVWIRLDAGDFLIYEEEKMITFTTDVNFVHKDLENVENTVLSYSNVMKFYVDNIGDLIIKSDGAKSLDKGVVRFFVDIVLPTIRGILHVKTAGTSLSRAYMPLLKAENLIK